MEEIPLWSFPFLNFNNKFLDLFETMLCGLLKIMKKELIAEQVLFLGLFALTLIQPKMTTAETAPSSPIYGPPNYAKLFERPPLDPPLPKVLKMPWECNVEALECTEENVKAAIEVAAANQGVSERLLMCISHNEARFNSYEVSDTNDHGPFQFHVNDPIWFRPYHWTMMDITPWAGHSYYEPLASAEAAAWLIKNGRGNQWTTFDLCT